MRIRENFLELGLNSDLILLVSTLHVIDIDFKF